ncbi:MAG TPA: alpha-glucan family phosphorylase [Sedimentisphaerales bacterium]|nr:alpha-glucan family phosphorylase [Sedimentisphaerales bacterium]
MIFKSIVVYPKYPETLQHLYDLVCNLWSVWDCDAIGLFYRIDTKLFREVNHNPLKFLNSLSKEKLEALVSDKAFLSELERVWEKFKSYIQHTSTLREECESEYGFKPDDVIAYFSMEFGLHESVPIYAGGLGVLSGDFLKGVSDLDLPIVGVGLLYKYGYFTQCIDPKGYQQEIFAPFENHLIPARELRDPQANCARINVKILNEEVKVKLWEIQVGKARLILLDTDIEENPPHLRNITDELYVSDREKRIQQELVLGIGGIKALNLLGTKVKVYHFNEGHSAFAAVGRLCDLMEDKKFSLSQAKAIIRASTVFTTHTPVIAGNENFKADLVKKYLQPKLKEINLTFDDIAELGFIEDNTDIFWMPAFAMRFSRHINAVSKQHVDVSRKMWAPLFPETPTIEIPIDHVTNGVHMSWISPPFTDLFNRYLGPEYIHCSRNKEIWRNIYNIPDEELWEEHRRNKKDLINYIRRQFRGQATSKGYSQFRKLGTNLSLNTDYLTVVFARRFAAYKRPTLILRDKERFKKILTDSARPVQMIFAGKAHPADQQSKEMIREVLDFAKQYQLEDRVIFLENYDINTGRHLCWGADVWLNTPSNNMEASGTSGMKAAMNGALHLSTLEGWWHEGYTGENGWAINAGSIYDKPDLQDMADAEQLYDLLEHEIAVLYYDRNETDIPGTWVKMMKESVFSVCQNFNINRVLCDYLKKYYLSSMQASEEITRDDYQILKTAAQEGRDVLKYWDNIRIMPFSTDIEKRGRLTKGEIVNVQCTVQLDQAPPELFSAELFYILDNNSKFKIIPMRLQDNQSGLANFVCSFETEGYGLQNINVRLKPANKIVRDLHPELVKWAE